MNIEGSYGCELSKAARKDLRKAVRCILVAGMASTLISWAEPSHGQQVPPGYEATTLDRMVVRGYRPTFESFPASSIVPISVNDVSYYVDGVLTGDTFLGAHDTGSYDEDRDQPEPKDNPEPRGDLDGACGKDSNSGFNALLNNPVDIVDGLKHASAVDFQSISNPLLKLSRYKNPRWEGQGILGQRWITNLDLKISFSDGENSCYPAPGQASCNMAAPKYINFYTERGGIIQLVGAGGIWRGQEEAANHHIRRLDDGKFLLQVRNSVFSPKYIFNTNGFIQSVDMRDGNRLTYTYDASNRLRYVTHNSGRRLVLDWSSTVPGAVTSITAPNNAVYSFDYYTEGVAYASGVYAPILKRVTYPDGKGNVEYVHETGTHTLFGDPRPYTHADEIMEIKINGVPVKEYTYEYHSRVTATKFSDGSELYRYNYDVPDPFVHEVTNPYGKKTSYRISGGKVIEVVGNPSPNCDASIRSASYYDNGLLEYTIDERESVTTYQYDEFGRKTKKIEGAGTPQQRVTRWVYDSNYNDVLHTDLVKKEIVEGVAETTYEYTTSDIMGDALYSAVSIRNLSSNGVSGQVHRTSYSYTFHTNGVIASVAEDGPIAGVGDRVIKRYNSYGDLVAVENSLGHKRTFSGHNGFGQPARIVNENGDVLEYEYDSRGRIVVATAVVNGRPQSTRYTYNGMGHLALIERPDGVEVTREYDIAGRLLREYETEWGGTFAVKKYTYNDASDVTSVTVMRTSAVIKPSGPPSMSIRVSGPGNYTVSWSRPSGTEYFLLQERVDDGSWGTAYRGASVEKTYEAMAEGNYVYRVRACNAEGCTAYSPETSTTVVYPPTGVPILTTPAKDSNGTFTVSWTAVARATKYYLWQRKDGDDVEDPWQRIYDDGALSMPRSGVPDGRYEFRVEACNAGGCGDLSDTKTTVVTRPPASAPTVTVPLISNTGAFTIRWTSVSSTTNYRLEQRKDSGSWAQIYRGTSLSKAVSGLTAGDYQYRVRACNAGGCSSYSTIDAIAVVFPPTTAPTLYAPSGMINSYQQTSYTVSWSSVPTATRYELSRSTSGTWGTAYSGPGTRKTFSIRAAGSANHRVRACNAGGCGPYSATKFVWWENMGGCDPVSGICNDPL